MKLKLIFSLLLGAALLPATTLHKLTIVTPQSITESGPYPDYGFYYSILSFLQAEVAAGDILTFGYTECFAPCTLAPPIYTNPRVPPLENPGPSKDKDGAATPEPASFLLLGLGLAAVGLGSLRSRRGGFGRG